MADVTNLMTFRSGQNQATDRPIAWHVWDILIPDALYATGDTFLLPDKFGPRTMFVHVGIQVVVVSNATTPTIGIRGVSILRSTGAQTLLANHLTGVSLTSIAYTFTGSGSTSFVDMFLDSNINNDLADGRLLVTLTKASAGTAQTRIFITALCGRNEY